MSLPEHGPNAWGTCHKNTGYHHLSSRWRQDPCPGQQEGWNVPPESPECLFEALIRTMMDNSRGAIKVISAWCYPATKEGGRSSSQRHCSSDAGSTMREVWSTIPLLQLIRDCSPPPPPCLSQRRKWEKESSLGTSTQRVPGSGGQNEDKPKPNQTGQPQPHEASSKHQVLYHGAFRQHRMQRVLSLTHLRYHLHFAVCT